MREEGRRPHLFPSLPTMTIKTRDVFLGAAALLAAGLTAGLVAYYVGLPASGAFSRDPMELLYVPEDATVVAYADVREIMDSDVRRQIRLLLSERALNGDADKRRRFEEETGIDVGRDVEHVVAYFTPGGAGGTPDRGLVLARGRFDQPRLEKFAEQDGGTIDAYKGKRLIIHRANAPAPGDATPAPEMALAFVQPGLVAVGASAAVRRAIDLESGGAAAITTNEALMALIHDNDDGNAWAVGSVVGLADRLKLSRQIAANLPPITRFAASAQIDTGVSALVKAEAHDEQAAQQLHDVVRGFLAFAKMQSGARPDLQTALQSLQLRVDGKTVVLSFALPSSALQALAAPRVP